MNKGLLGGIMFVVGAASGVAGTYFYMKRKMEKEIDDEVQKYKDEFNAAQVESLYFHTIDTSNDTVSVPPVEEQKEQAVKLRNKPPITNYSKMYVSHAGKEMTIEEYMDKSGLIVDIPKNHPHVISEYEYTNDDEYDKYNYILYADGIMADEDKNIISYEEGNENGFDYDVIYGFLMQDVTSEIYYRNEELERDFEILKSAQFFDED